MPASNIYRRLVDGRNRKRLADLRAKQRERLIESFDPREREAVLYLQWLKNKIFDNYVKFTGAKDLPTNIRSLEQRWEDFVDLLDVYRRRKHHLRSINRQAVQNQLTQAERAVENSPDDRSRRIQQANVEILRRRLAQFAELERSVKLVEGQLQSIENFFGLVNDQVITLPTPERVSSLDFEQLSDSIAMTKQMLEETSDVMGVLDSHNREVGHFDLLPSNSSSAK
ncbi:MAG TPA: hypothetical protein VN228_02150 [Pyrinomonadaceae bacterium]|nr:hypothetical protein [Pyrinomonadaceae bacterium]